ncbi:MAG: LacI family DNA-binding transcriptional regulator [Anaerolineaceae bacterium]|nr:LacI family DNA-binding transcriptional regulator [Anaerolineae bacterium]MCB9459690.1 LacI family DNA-binding transcriptional regulator [Anaerolineaceae bacterium]
MPTIRDVARYAEVSVGTVSNVLNGSTLVKSETRQRVLEAIEALDYHPTAAARSLNTQRTNTIGLIRSEIRLPNDAIETDPVVLDLIDGVTSEATRSSIGLTFWTVPAGEREMQLYKQLVTSRQIDGLIVFALRENDPRVAYLTEQNFPFVVFGRFQSEKGQNWIDVDGAIGIELAVKHLFELGHRRIGYLSPPHEQYLTQVRWEGFISGMREATLPIDRSLIFEGDFSEQSGQLGAHYLLDQFDPPTAIICSNDRMAFGAMRAIQVRGLVVGQDVSVVGFDDIPLARYSNPPLTTINQPTRDIGKALFQLLMKIVNQEPTADLGSQLIKPELIVRQSTGSPL